MNIYRWNGAGWDPIAGSLKTIVAGGGNAVFGTNDEDNVFSRVGSDWVQITGGDNPKNTLKSITAAGCDAWGIDENSRIFRIGYVGTSFTSVSGSLISIDGGLRLGGGELWGINASNDPFRWDGNTWRPVGGKLTIIAVGGREVWGINSDSDPFRWDGHDWQPVGGTLRMISVDSGYGSESAIWGINDNKEIFRWEGRNWLNVPGKLTSISVAKSNVMFGSQSNAVWGLH